MAKILVVDDEPGIVAIARDYLDRAGFRVVTAGDGPNALRLARSRMLVVGPDLPHTYQWDPPPGQREHQCLVLQVTPELVERLQGFPDGWTLPTHEMANQDALDSARYHACGNAVSVPVAEWIGQRIVETMGTQLLQASEPIGLRPKSA